MVNSSSPEIASRHKLVARWGALKNERGSWRSHWKDISTRLLPRSGRFFVEERNRGERRHNTIYDNTGTRALRILAAGMMSGMTSPARPWFRLATSDQDLMKYQPVKVWLNETSMLVHTVFQRSNTYRALHSIYEELGAFGTAANIVLPDFKNIIHHYPLTVGEYCISTNWKGEVNTLYREFQKTVAETVEEFGIGNVTQTVRNLYDRGALDRWVTIIHAIEPRSDRDVTRLDNVNMPWRSVYFEAGSDPDRNLRESGFSRFPALCPRWCASGGDIYGSSPGMEALGDIQQLQHEQLRKAQGIDYQTNPPLQVPSGMKNRDVDALPGGVSFVDMAGPNAGIRTAFEVKLDLSHLLADIQDVRHRINSAFYADLFLMLANQTNSRMTATEVAERHEEKLLMLGPVLERLQNELLDPLIEITFDQIMRAGILPPPPEELQGHSINVELVSMLAQAQRAVGTNSIDRFVGNLGMVAQLKPDALDCLDADRWVSVYAEALGIDPSILADDDTVKARRDQRMQVQQQEQQAAMLNQVVNSTQKLASSRTGESNALTDVVRSFSGYT